MGVGSGVIDGGGDSPVSSLDCYSYGNPGVGDDISSGALEPSTFNLTMSAGVDGLDEHSMYSPFAFPVDAYPLFGDDASGQNLAQSRSIGACRATPTPEAGSCDGESTNTFGQSSPSHAQHGERPQRREPALVPNKSVPSGPTDTSHPFKCRFCGQPYTTSSNRNQHERQKHGERPKRSGRPRKALQPVIIS